MKYLLSALIVVVVSSCCYAEDNLVFYGMGRKDPAAWSILREYFSSKSHAVSFYQGDGVIEHHLEKANRINAMKSGVFVAIEFVFGEGKHMMVAMVDSGGDSRANAGTGVEGRRLLWAVDELPAKHEAQSKRLADLVAAQLGVTARKVPLFPLIGIDMPGIMVSIECGREEAKSLLAMFEAALQKYYRRDKL